MSLYTVAQELAYGSEDMMRRVYARLGKVRHRSEVPEFRPEQWFDEVGGRFTWQVELQRQNTEKGWMVMVAIHPFSLANLTQDRTHSAAYRPSKSLAVKAGTAAGGAVGRERVLD